MCSIFKIAIIMVIVNIQPILTPNASKTEAWSNYKEVTVTSVWWEWNIKSVHLNIFP